MAGELDTVADWGTLSYGASADGSTQSWMSVHEGSEVAVSLEEPNPARYHGEPDPATALFLSARVTNGDRAGNGVHVEGVLRRSHVLDIATMMAISEVAQDPSLGRCLKLEKILNSPSGE